MPLIIVRNDITKMNVDAIVNAANETLLGGGGVDGAIHRAAGRGLLEECRTLGGCKTGKAKITGGYDLPAKYVIHTVGPIYEDGRHGEAKQLKSCYVEALNLARENGCRSVAFPLISSGAYGYPKREAYSIAVGAICDFLLENDMTVYLVIFDKASFILGEKIFSSIREYIDDNYVDTNYDPIRERRRVPRKITSYDCASPYSIKPYIPKMSLARASDDLDTRLGKIDESFSEMLLRKIDERGITDAECYKKANIDRKLFSKIRSDINYRPSKPTAIAFAISLELTLDETNDMLRKAGFALSHSNKFDIIIEYFISLGNYNVYEINEALFAFDQPLLGGVSTR